MGKEDTVTTEILLKGRGVEDHLRRKRVFSPLKDEEGNVVVMKFSGEGRYRFTPFGRMIVCFGLVENTNNREVILHSPGLRRKGRKMQRRISVDSRDGIGSQQLTNGVEVIVRTNAPAQYFERNKR